MEILKMKDERQKGFKQNQSVELNFLMKKEKRKKI